MVFMMNTPLLFNSIQSLFECDMYYVLYKWPNILYEMKLSDTMGYSEELATISALLSSPGMFLFISKIEIKQAAFSGITEDISEWFHHHSFVEL